MADASLPTTAAATTGESALTRTPASQLTGRVGRYVLLREIGAGGMGTVWEAYDPALDRVIALKLMLDHREDAAALEREARALARVRDANVVAVHDAGREDAVVYIAMELVRGHTLKSWLAAAEHSRQRIVDVLCAAGRGLAAIHAAGLVHRDVKPTNILLGDDGRVCIGDLGIAFVADGATTPGFAGTPGYMAPEQERDEHTDERSDQYGFCVTAWEALTGARLGTGESRALPSPLRAILERGLAEDPAQRWPAMIELVGALERWRGRRRRAFTYAAGALAVAIAAAGALALGGDERASACAGVDAEIDRTWSPARRAALALAFAKVTSPVAEGAWRRSEQVIDGWVSRWRMTRIEACEATKVRRSQPPDTMERRTTCLARRTSDLDALLAALARPDADSAPLAISAALALDPPEACLTDSDVQKPDTAPVAGLRRRLAEGRALRKLGKVLDAIAIEEQIVREAEPIDHALHAQALFELGAAQEAAGQQDAAIASLERAVRVADRAGADELRFAAWGQLAFVIGEIKADRASGERILDQLDALYDRLPPSKMREALLTERKAGYARTHGDYKACVSYAARSEALREETDPTDPEAPTEAMNLRGICLSRMGQDRAAYEIFNRVLEMRRQALGEDHPRTAIMYNNVASIAHSLGDYEAAERLHRRAIAIRERVLPQGHRDLAQSHNNLANTLVKLKRGDEAFEHAEQAYQIWSTTIGPRTVLAAFATSVMGHAARAQKRYDVAEQLYRRALDIRREVRGPDHEDVTRVMNDLANVLVEHGRIAEAIALAEDAWKRTQRRETDAVELADHKLDLAMIVAADPRQRARALELARQACPLLDHPDYPVEKKLCDDFVARGGVPAVDQSN